MRLFLSVLFLCVELASCVRFEIRPKVTSDFVDDNVLLKCDTLGIDALSITSIGISAEESLTPLAVLGKDGKVVAAHSHLIKSSGKINQADPSASTLSVTLIKPTYVQAGNYICTVSYVNKDKVSKTQTVTATLVVKQVDVYSLLKELKKQAREIDELRLVGNKCETRQSKSETDITTIETTLSKRMARQDSIEQSLKLSVKANTDHFKTYTAAMTTFLQTTLATFEGHIAGLKTDVKKSTPRCPDETWTKRKGVCVKLFTSGMSWDTARDFCHSQGPGGRMMDVLTKEDNDFMAGLSTGHYTWIGLHDINHEHRFVLDSGYTSSYRAWVKNQPDGGVGQNCVHTYSGAGWWDDECYEKYPFVCQVDFSMYH